MINLFNSVIKKKMFYFINNLKHVKNIFKYQNKYQNMKVIFHGMIYLNMIIADCLYVFIIQTEYWNSQIKYVQSIKNLLMKYLLKI